MFAENNCGTDKDSVYVNIISFKNLSLPNIITPNGDGRNDFLVIDEKLSGTPLYVYNRWGKLIFSDNSYTNDWSAANVPLGVYFYITTLGCNNKLIKNWLHVLK